MKGNLQFIFILLSFFLLLMSCKKEEGTSWDTEWLGPLCTTTLGIDDIVADSLLDENPDSSLSIVFENEVYNVAMDSLVEVPDTVIRSAYQLPISLTLNPGQTIVNTSENYNFSTESAKLNKVIVRQGYVKFHVKSSVKEKLLITYDLPKATLNGVPLHIQEPVPAGTFSTNGEVIRMIDISGYTFDLTGSAGNSYNTLATNYKIQVDPAGSSVLVQSSDSVVMRHGFVEIVPEYLRGYLGNESTSVGPESQGFSVFSHVVSGGLQIENISLDVIVENNFGVDARVIVSKLNSVNTHTGNVVPLVSPLIGNTLNIGRAMDNNGLITPTVYHYPVGNTAAKSFLENLPNRIEYAASMMINPMGNISGGNDFAWYGKGLRVKMNLNMPLSLIADQLTLADTVSLNIKEDTTGTRVTGGRLYLYADNGFPFEAQVQLYLLNDMLQVTDSLMVQNLAAAAPVDVNLKVVAPKRSVLIADAPAEKLDKIYKARKMRIVARFHTLPAGQYLKIYSHYKFGLKVAADFKLHVVQ